MEPRKIIHIDMDAFYASVEQRDNPELRGKPVAVGGSRQRGVVAAASYEARKFGVRSAMPSTTAARKCPNLIFVPPRFDVYKQVSNHIRSIFEEYTDLIEPLSLDEAYLDVTNNKKNMEYAMDVAQEIRDKIFQQLNLTASAGISYNKFLAKTASDINKPNGYYVITPKMADRFIDTLPIEKFFGVGKVTAKKMKEKGIFSGKELKVQTKQDLKKWFGKAGGYYFNVARGEDNRPVNPNRIRKSVGAERTYDEDIPDMETLQEKIEVLSDIVFKRLENHGTSGKTLTLKVKYGDFQQITRSNTIDQDYTLSLIKTVSVKLLEQVPNIEVGIRLLGLQISNFDIEHETEVEKVTGQLEFDFG